MARIMIVFAMLVALPLDAGAQYGHIARQGRIEYEVKINRLERARKLLSVQASAARYRDHILSLRDDRFLTRNYRLDFDPKRSAYVLLEQEEPQDFIDLLVGIPTASVFRDMETDSVFVRKQFGDDRFPIAERAEKIKWKHTGERMDIMGCECRRANGLFMDSVYVVAFYCPDIDVPAGPSLFGGLPGMILGVSLPQEHVNIFATKMSLGQRPAIKREAVKNGAGQSSFSAFGEYLESIIGDRFDARQWNMNMRGMRF